jgi:hypothetical protein
LPSLLTWRLWRALRSPDELNPLFERIQGQPVDIPGQKLLRPLAPIGRVVGVILPAIIVVIAPAALLLAANFLGGLVAFNIMSTINREREQGTYDLLALTPMGLGRANWLIAEACTLRVNAVERLAQVRTLAIITLVLVTFYLMRFGALAMVVMLAVIVALNIDGIQSLILGGLSGMLAQEFSEQGAPFAALAIFAFVQIILVYLPVTALAILIFDLSHPTRRSVWTTYTLIALVVLALVFLWRELIIQIMWRALEKRLL